MRLERLELSGFKSFPDRADVRFDTGVTAIVGPNGCGKSNIVDAITWVLGEQSAKSLRGDRMEDVIFGGSDARKATAAAEVGSTCAAWWRGRSRPGTLPGLDGETAVDGVDGRRRRRRAAAPRSRATSRSARRLYRSGESEYLIDGHAVRLRDVQDILMDVGVGVKGYAVIEQGKIGQILSSKPTDRRQLIEEAAGVTKFKSRRRQAELKLEAAQQNLTRVDDLVYELERQRAALKRQAGKARRYQRLRGELRRWEKLLFAQRYERLTEAIARLATRSPRSASARQVAAARLAEVETRSRARAHRADRGREPGQRPRASGAPARARERAAAAADHVRPAAGRVAGADGPGDRRRAAGASRRGAGRRATRSRRAARRRRPPTPNGTPPARRCAARRAPSRRSRAEIGRSIATSTRPARGVHRQPAVDDHAAAHDRARRRRPAAHRRRARTPRRRSPAICASKRSARAPSACRREEALAAAQAALAETRRRAAGARVGARHARASSATGASATRATQERRVAGARSPPALAAGARGEPRRLRRSGAPGARLAEAGVTHHGSVADYLEVDAGGERAVEAARRPAAVRAGRDAEPTPTAGWPSCASAAPAAAASCRARGDVLVSRRAASAGGGRAAIDAVVRVIGPHEAPIRWALGDALDGGQSGRRRGSCRCRRRCRSSPSGRGVPRRPPSSWAEAGGPPRHPDDASAKSGAARATTAPHRRSSAAGEMAAARR